MSEKIRYYKSRKELKDQAKSVFKGQWLTLATVLGCLLALPSIFNSFCQEALGPLFGIASLFVSEEMIADQEIYFTIISVSAVIAAVLFLAQILFYPVAMSTQFKLLEKLREPDKQDNLCEMIFYIYKKHRFFKFIGLYIVSYLFVALWACLLIIPGIIKMCSYSQAFYIWYDSLKAGKELTILESITRSRQLMDGHKKDFFMLCLSFIGWLLVVVIISFIGYVIFNELTYLLGVIGMILGIIAIIITWIPLLLFNAYFYTTLAAYYNDLVTVEPKESQPTAIKPDVNGDVQLIV